MIIILKQKVFFILYIVHWWFLNHVNYCFISFVDSWIEEINALGISSVIQPCSEKTEHGRRGIVPVGWQSTAVVVWTGVVATSMLAAAGGSNGSSDGGHYSSHAHHGSLSGTTPAVTGERIPSAHSSSVAPHHLSDSTQYGRGTSWWGMHEW